MAAGRSTEQNLDIKSQAAVRRGTLGRRRWLRYSLRGLFAAVLVAALPVWWLRLEVDDLAAEHDAIVKLRQLGADIFTAPAEPRWFWKRMPTTLARHAERAVNVFLDADSSLRDENLPLVARCRRVENLHINITNPTCSITDSGLGCLAQLTTLKSLGIRNCHSVTGAGLRNFVKCGGLTSVDLTGSAVEDAVADYLVLFPSLSGLALSGTRLTDAAMPTVALLTGLRGLSLPQSVTSNRLTFLLPLHKMENLHISLHASDDVAALEAVCAFAKLEQLSLSGQGLTDGGLKAITQARGLKALYLCQGPTTLDGLAALKTLPKLRLLEFEAAPPRLSQVDVQDLLAPLFVTFPDDPLGLGQGKAVRRERRASGGPNTTDQRRWSGRPRRKTQPAPRHMAPATSNEKG